MYTTVYIYIYMCTYYIRYTYMCMCVCVHTYIYIYACLPRKLSYFDLFVLRVCLLACMLT